MNCLRTTLNPRLGVTVKLTTAPIDDIGFVTRWDCGSTAVRIVFQPDPLLPRSPLSLPHRLSHHFFSCPAEMSLIRDMGGSSSSRLQLIFEAALDGYEEKTGMKLIDNPLARQLENCNSMESIITLLQEQALAFRQFRGDDGKVMKSLKSIVHVLHALSTSTVLGEGIGLVRRMALMV